MGRGAEHPIANIVLFYIVLSNQKNFLLIFYNYFNTLSAYFQIGTDETNVTEHTTHHTPTSTPVPDAGSNYNISDYNEIYCAEKLKSKLKMMPIAGDGRVSGLGYPSPNSVQEGASAARHWQPGTGSQALAANHSS